LFFEIIWLLQSICLLLAIVSFKLYCSLKLYDCHNWLSNKFKSGYKFQTLLFFEIIWLANASHLARHDNAVSNSIVLWNYMIERKTVKKRLTFQGFKLYCSLKLYDWTIPRPPIININVFQTLLFFEIIWLTTLRKSTKQLYSVSNSIVLWNYMIGSCGRRNGGPNYVSNSIVLWNYMIEHTTSLQSCRLLVSNSIVLWNYMIVSR